MRHISKIMFVAALGLAGLSSAQAMPSLGVAAPPSSVVSVEGGCGIGWHRGPGGGCRRNYGRVYRVCPPGFHVGYYGRCRPN